MDVVAAENELAMQRVQPMLGVADIAMRFMLEVMDAIGPQKRDVIGSRVADLHDTGLIDSGHEPIIVYLG